MTGCEICGQPVYLTVDERLLCASCSREVLLSIEEAIDRIRERSLRLPPLVTRFATVEDFINERVKVAWDKTYGR